MSAFDYGRLMSLLRLAGMKLVSMADDHEDNPEGLKSVMVVLRDLADAERDLKTCRKIVLRERASIRLTGHGT